MSSTKASDLPGTSSASRKLIAVVYADMVGYSRLIGLDDSGTLERLRALRNSVIDPAIAEHGGRLVQTGGDSLLIVFDSIDGAVRCAVKVQQEIPGHDVAHAPDRTIRFRIGINIGDAIADGTDLHGDSVNVAARLQAECPAGGICISRAVRDHVHGRLELAFEALGALNLKNIARPVEAFVLRPAGAAAALKTVEPSIADNTIQSLRLPDGPSIAVLPFTNLSGDPEQEYFADGMVEDITTALSRLNWLFVIARNSSFTYKGKAVDVRQVGRELGVRYVLEGSVRKAANRVRISGQLVDATTGAHLWADHFDGSLEDVFELQDQVTASVAGAIKPRLQRAEIERAKRKPTQDLGAYDYYLRGMASVHQMTRESIEAALGLFAKAFGRDPEYAAALAMAAWCTVLRKANGWIADYEREVTEGVQRARRAAAVGRDDVTALWSAGVVLAYVGGELETGAALIDRACLLNPNLATAWNAAGYVQTFLGEPERGIASLERAMLLSPLDPLMYTFQAGIAQAYLVAERYEEAVVWAERAIHEQPSWGPPLRYLAAAYALSGRIADAHRVMAMVHHVYPSLRLSNAREFIPSFRRPQDTERYLNGLRLAGLPE